MNRLYGCAVDPDSEITVTPGGTYAIYAALTTILRPGDEVILFEPAYDSYIPQYRDQWRGSRKDTAAIP